MIRQQSFWEEVNHRDHKNSHKLHLNAATHFAIRSTRNNPEKHSQNEAPHSQLPLLRPQDLQNQPSSLPSAPQRRRTRTSRSRNQPFAHSKHAAEDQLGSSQDDFTRGPFLKLTPNQHVDFLFQSDENTDSS